MGYSHKGLTYLNPILQVVRKIGVALHIVSPNRLRVLIYHDIPSEEEGAFRKQMHSLKKHWNIITPSEFEQMITGGSQVNGDNLLITFDDGQKGVYNNAYPILEELNCPSLVFLNMAPIKGEIFWSGLVIWIKETLVNEGTISEKDLELIYVVNSPNEILTIIDDFYENYLLKPNF